MKKSLFSAIVICSVICFSCEEKAELMRVFTIKKGEHYSTPRVVETLQASSLVFMAKFDQSAVYYHDSKGFQDSKNKLMGFSDCNALHHENSARFAWQWFNDQLEIYAYCYVDGTRVEEYVGKVELNVYNQYTITVTEDTYAFRLNQQEPVFIKRGSVCNTGVYYKLWPYFGGSLPAPHNVTIAIQDN